METMEVNRYWAQLQHELGVKLRALGEAEIVVAEILELLDLVGTTGVPHRITVEREVEVEMDLQQVP
jgi:hypothetical protein